MLKDILQGKLDKRKRENSLRKLTSQTGLIDFVSNDYLGLARSKQLYELIQNKITELPKMNGATGSRLLSGNASFTETLETKLAKIFKSEAALIFNAGYMANLGVLSSLPQKGDTIVYDELVHACIKDGARLSAANRYSFKHNDLNDLEKKIRRSHGKIFIAVESIYSMDGDESPLTDLVKLSEQYDAFLILDEAHATGSYGDRGGGLATQLGLEDKIHVRIYTFGKAMGVHGACVTGEKKLIEYLINFSRPFVYTTALPMHSIAAIDCSFDFLESNITLQTTLRQKINLYLSLTQYLENQIPSKSAIQSVIISGNEKSRKMAGDLQNNGFDVRAILSPTVRQDTERLRICLHTYNSDVEIENLASHLKKLQT